MPSSPPEPRPIFSGEFRHALDSKNRVTIPSRWRRDHDKEEFFLVSNPLKSCLTAMPPEVFQAVGEDAKTRVPPDKRQDFIRSFYAHAQHTSLDKQGRVLVTEEQCRAANLKGEVVMAGALDRFEIWSPAAWEQFREGEKANYLEVARQIGL
jgi:MraZ protein